MSRPRAFTREELEAASPPIHTESRPIRFQDVDAAGTLFYPRLLEYFSDAYLGLLAAGRVNLWGRIADGSFRAPIVHAEADYFVPLRFGDTATVEITGAKVGQRSFTLGFRVLRQDGMLAAVGQVVYVTIDRVTFQSTPVPDDLRDKLTGDGSEGT